MKIAMLGLKGIPWPGGIETVVEQVGSRLAERGHQVTVFVRPHYTPRQVSQYKGMRLVSLPSIATKNLDAITHSLLSVLVATSARPDVVHIHATGSSVYAFLPRWMGIPSVVTSHGLDWQRSKWGRLARQYLRFTDYTTCRFPSKTTAVSRSLQRYYQAKYKKEVIYIPNGSHPVDKRPASEIRKMGLEGNDYIFFASRLVPEKGCHYLIEAYQQLDTNMKLVIAGDGVLGDEYARSLSRESDQKILFLGFTRGLLLEELLSNAYIYVLPSEVEGLSTGLIEAMSYGNCVLASNIAENQEVIEDSGITFQNKDVRDLREKLQVLLDHPQLVADYKQNSAGFIGHKYNWSTVTSQYEQVYQSLLK